MRVVVIGGTGHIGSWLVPRLVRAGHEVVVLSRGQRRPYRDDPAWQQVDNQPVDRDLEEGRGTFGPRVAALQPDVVVDLISFNVASTRHLVESLDGVQHFLHCGTNWVHGPSRVVPATEADPRRPVSEYGIAKAEIERYLHHVARTTGFPATVVLPGHISGPGWVPINPVGNINPEVFRRLAEGDPVVLPNDGMELLQHVHADDVAGVFLAAIDNRAVSIGESFHAVAETAMTLRGYADVVASWFGRDAELQFLPWESWSGQVGEEDARITADHLRHGLYCSMEKAQRLLGFRPRHGQQETLREAVDWLFSAAR